MFAKVFNWFKKKLVLNSKKNNAPFNKDNPFLIL